MSLNVSDTGTEYDFCTFLSTDYLLHKNIFSLYPNPVTKRFTISFEEDMFNASIRIFNTFGEQVYSESFSGREKAVECELISGIYFVEITEGNKRWVQKLIYE